MIKTYKFKTPADINRAMSILANDVGGFTKTGKLSLRISTKQIELLREKGIVE